MMDFRENMKKDLERYKENKKFNCLINFKALLKEFEKNPKQYSKIVIRTDFVGAKSGYHKRTEFDGSEVIKEHCDEIWELMTLLMIRYDISDCIESEFMAVAFFFNDDSDADHRKIISMFFFKN